MVVENFSYVFQLTGPVSLTREEMRSFKKIWAEFDPSRKGYLRRSQFVGFFGVCHDYESCRSLPLSVGFVAPLWSLRSANLSS